MVVVEPTVDPVKVVLDSIADVAVVGGAVVTTCTVAIVVADFLIKLNGTTASGRVKHAFCRNNPPAEKLVPMSG